MNYDLDDTIAAIATPSAGAARGIVRVSGPDAIDVVARCFTADDGRPLDQLRHAAALAGHAQIALEEAAQEFAVPCDLFAWPTNLSYTRQPVAELHTLGSPPILSTLLAAVCAAGARLAEPGEFTLRAFLAGRIDLTQAESVLGVIDAQSTDELHASLAQLAGGLARPLHQLREELLQLLAELEAGLDFVDEDIQFIEPDELIERLHAASQLLGDLSTQMVSRHTATELPQVALVGLPNVGKSSLFNALVARLGGASGGLEDSQHTALVSPQRGTTRDYLIAAIKLNDVRCQLVDMAGIEDKSETRANGIPTAAMDASAQELAAERRARATIRVLCSDQPEQLATSANCEIFALTKADVVQHRRLTFGDSPSGIRIVVTSSRTGQGLDELAQVIHELLTRDSTTTRPGPFVAATVERCRESIRLAEAAIRRAANAVESGSGDELVAVEIRDALAELGKVVGAIYTDDLLDRIFSSFCIGK